MSIAVTLREFLDRKRIPYEIVAHPYSESSSRAAAQAHLPGDQVVKAIALADERGFLLVAIPATHRLQLGRLHRCYNRHMGLATEQDLSQIFDDCEVGAVPPIGEPYGLDVLVDISLTQCKDVYFEAGDHCDLVHMNGTDFRALMAGADHGHFSERV